MDTTASARFIAAGVRFFAVALVLGLALLLAAPLDIVRVLCGFALACAAAGFALHVGALRATDPGAFAKLGERFITTIRRVRATFSGAFASTGVAADTVWPCTLQ